VFALLNNCQFSRTERRAILRPNIDPVCGALHKTPLKPVRPQGPLSTTRSDPATGGWSEPPVAHSDGFCEHRRAKQSVKPMRGEGRSVSAESVSAESVCSCAFVYAFGTRGRGCGAPSVFPALSVLYRRNVQSKPRAYHVAECETVSCVIASAAKQSTSPLAARWISSLRSMTWKGRNALKTPMRGQSRSNEHNRRSLLKIEHTSRHTSPHCCRNSNLPAPMRRRASVQLLPACETYC
jgi:hypothetical protein